MKRVLVHIVTWNSAAVIEPCIEKACVQEGFVLGDNLHIRITDNASTDETVSLVQLHLRPGVSLVRNGENLGFCGGHNQGIAEFLSGKFDAILILNPDVGLEPAALRCMTEGLDDEGRVGMVTPKLLRALPSLEAIHPPVLDAAGMILTNSCRHFDRGAGMWDIRQFDTGECVFGGTGACLMLSRSFVESVKIPDTIGEDEVFKIYPQLRSGASSRPQLFDEAFFAYREDADLSWRAERLGWKCWYEPKAVAHHVRLVLPERRYSLPAPLNAYSVRNRFLLQIHNWAWSRGLLFFLVGIVLRNIVVIGGVLTIEHSSLGALQEVKLLLPRALRIRAWIRARAKQKA